MNRTNIVLVAAWLVILSGSAMGGSPRYGTGMLFGEDHAFNFTACDGWILDNESGVPQGLHMVFYPKGFTYRNSPVIAYGRSVTKSKEIRSIEDQVKTTVDVFHRNGNPNYKSKVGEKIILSDGRVVCMYYYSGDQWGNYEAVGYAEERNTINFLVFNAKKLNDYEKYLAGFKSILMTYRDVYTNNIDDDAFTQLVSEADGLLFTVEGKNYEREVVNDIGPYLANVLRDCISYVDTQDNDKLEIVFRIKKSGEVQEIYGRPSSALTSCVKGMILPYSFPPHEFKTSVQYFEIKIRD